MDGDAADQVLAGLSAIAGECTFQPNLYYRLAYMSHNMSHII